MCGSAKVPAPAPRQAPVSLLARGDCFAVPSCLPLWRTAEHSNRGTIGRPIGSWPAHQSFFLQPPSCLQRQVGIRQCWRDECRGLVDHRHPVLGQQVCHVSAFGAGAFR